MSNPQQPSTPGTPDTPSIPGTPLSTTPQIRIASQAFRYGQYSSSSIQTRTLRPNSDLLQFIINTLCDDGLIGQKVKISIEIRDRDSRQTLFETFWVTSITHLKQQSAFIFRDLPPELRSLQTGKTYTYYASILITETQQITERTTRALVR